MQEIRSSNPPVATGICDPNKSRTRHHRSLIFALKLHSRNYMPPILVPSSAKRIATQILVIAKLNGRKDFILRGFICDIIRPSKELPVQS